MYLCYVKYPLWVEQLSAGVFQDTGVILGHVVQVMSFSERGNSFTAWEVSKSLTNTVDKTLDLVILWLSLKDNYFNSNYFTHNFTNLIEEMLKMAFQLRQVSFGELISSVFDTCLYTSNQVEDLFLFCFVFWQERIF